MATSGGAIALIDACIDVREINRAIVVRIGPFLFRRTVPERRFWCVEGIARGIFADQDEFGHRRKEI